MIFVRKGYRPAQSNYPQVALNK